MAKQLWSTIQALVEYGAVSSGKVAGGTGVARITTWAADHRVALGAVAAGLALLWMVRAASRR